MGLIHRLPRAGIVAVTGLAITALSGAYTSAAVAAAPPAASDFVAVSGSLPAVTNAATGAYQSSRMSVEVALAPRQQAEMSRQLAAVYDRRSPDYQHWLTKGQFDARYAPASAARAAVAKYLAASGLVVAPSASPFLVRATGSSQRVSAAFRTTLSTYQNARGARYFANSSPVRLPRALARGVLGVIGLTNTVREHSMVAHPTGRPAGSRRGCEAPYPSKQAMFEFADDLTAIPVAYGGGPGCNGLTPSQDNSIYGAPRVGPRGKGAGVNLALFELSAYRRSDIVTWTRTFYGPRYRPPLVNVAVDGGPLHPDCPAGDTCPPEFNGFAGDIEAVADIQMQLAIAPAARHIIVYQAPNDLTGQTVLDNYTKIADDDIADVVSSSWGFCEADLPAAFAQAENEIFRQMALQGQSMFASSGDAGAFTCLESDGVQAVTTTDPASQPWVTGVGGTSLETANPGHNPNPAYPRGVETVWNPYNLCSTRPNEGGHPGSFWCLNTGAGGGGSSQFWGRPFYQFGKGVTNRYTTYGNRTTHCALARRGTPCREIPDISANADPFTPYAEYCTGNPDPPFYSNCGTFSGSQTPPGWFGIGGTSLSSPLWSAIIADRDSFRHSRSGNISPLLYLLYNLSPRRYFHDITGVGPLQAVADNNGKFPARPGYDLATGIGTPKMAALITGTF